eukprot:c22972_g1_i1.p1 GENE.c22972_g1_i1~~c22972_g1_i1.p1  ORF type:complete len:467 (-),score=126.65 c22972_g1_i1:339-1697(-)
MSVPLHLSKSRHTTTTQHDYNEPVSDTQGKTKSKQFANVTKRLLVAVLLLVVVDVCVRVGIAISQKIDIQKTQKSSHLFEEELVDKDKPKSANANSVEYCDSVHLYTDPKKNGFRFNTQRPTISLIYITKRPGGYDILLNSLSQQVLSSAPNLASVLEVICVDELAAYRAQRVYQMAQGLNVPVVAVVPSKPRSLAHVTARYNLYNAINTGLLLARGDVVVFAMDYVWLPEILIQRVLDFYADSSHATTLLGFPEQFYHLGSPYRPSVDVISENNRVSVFSNNISVAFHDSNMKVDPSGMFEPGMGRPKEVFEKINQGKYVGVMQQPVHEFAATMWETVMATPFSCLEHINGAEEVFDSGNDSHETNIWMRCQYLGYNVFMDGDVVLESLWHSSEKDFPNKKVFGKSASDSVQQEVIIEEMSEIVHGRRRVQSQGHDFDLTAWRKFDCAGKL